LVANAIAVIARCLSREAIVMYGRAAQANRCVILREVVDLTVRWERERHHWSGRDARYIPMTISWRLIATKLISPAQRGPTSSPPMWASASCET
jgi:hypothetical protein